MQQNMLYGLDAAGLLAGWAYSGLLVSLSFSRAIARLVPGVCGTLPPREGGLHGFFFCCSMLGWLIVPSLTPWRSSFPCHRMCCGPDTLLWFVLSVFRVADMIGIDGHVSFLPREMKQDKKSGLHCLLGRIA